MYTALSTPSSLVEVLRALAVVVDEAVGRRIMSRGGLLGAELRKDLEGGGREG